LEASSVFIDVKHIMFGYNPLVDDMLLSSIFGGALIGFGLGLIFKSKATSGGSDIIAMIIARLISEYGPEAIAVQKLGSQI